MTGNCGWRNRLAWCGAVIAVTTAIGVAPAGAAAAPGAPKITSAVAAKQGATLTFTRPASDGGARILDYRVTCTSTDGGAPVKRTTAKSPISITGMAVKKHYTCVVAARNSAGVGAASKPSSTIVPLPQDGGQPPPPPALQGVRPGSGRIYVQYQSHGYESPRTKLTVVKYRARCYSSNGGVTRRGERIWTQDEIEVKHVTSGKTYRCVVSAANFYGWGPYSAPSEAVVPNSEPEAPSAPKITSATAIVHGVNVAFTPPVSDGRAAIIDYRLRCSSTNGGAAVERTVPRRSPYKMLGLSVGKTYTCILRARNSAGVGAKSAASPAVVPLAG